VEIIVMLTPHIIHMPEITADDMLAMDVGTVTQPRLPSLSAPGPNATEPPAPRPTAAPAPAAPAFGAPVQPIGAIATPATPATAAISFPAGQSVFASQKATPVNIMVNGTDIAGAELTLSYDPKSIAISQIADGGFLSRDGQLIAVAQQIESEAGKAHITIKRPPEASSIAGTGNLLTLTIIPQDKKGDSVLRVTDVQLRDARQNIHPGGAAETKITIQ
jgi:hypothetical protein